MIFALFCFNSSDIFTLQLPVLGIPLRMIVVYSSLAPSFLQFYNNIGIILQGGSGKNKSTIAVSHAKKKITRVKYQEKTHNRYLESMHKLKIGDQDPGFLG